MPIQILMPALSPTMEDGTLAKWLVKEGDTVTSGDLLAEIETDKATMEFEASDDGIIGQLLVAEGSEGVTVNTPIALLFEEGESREIVETSGPAQDDTVASSRAADITPPQAAGLVSAQATGAQANVSRENRVFASPLARRIAAEKGIDLQQITGSGPRGRIVKTDVESATATAAQPIEPAPRAVAPSSAPVAKTAGVDAGAITKIYSDRPHHEVTLDGMRRTIAARLTEAKQTIPHFYLRRSVRLDPLMDLRADLNAQLAPRGVKLSINDFIIKACALALQQVPAANAVWAGDRILQLEPSDVAVAVAVEGGLFTPVLQDAQAKSLSALSAEMKDLAARARDRKLTPSEYQGGSFAISNLGMFGIESFDAVINPPHGAILAVGAGIKQPVVSEDGALTTATVMTLTLSVDHRVIDGALGAQLLGAIVDNLHSPLAMLA